MKDDVINHSAKFSKSEEELHKYICSHLDEIQHLTIRELAGQAGTHPNTVVRYYKNSDMKDLQNLREGFKMI